MKLLVSIVLLLAQVYRLSAHPVDCSEVEEESGSGESDMSLDPEPATREIPFQRPVLNEYILQYFLHQHRLKESNCTELFMEQNVTHHLCSSNTIKLYFPQDSELNGTEGSRSEASLYEFCASSENEVLGETLGYDMALYKRPTPQDENGCRKFDEFSVFITETIVEDGFTWEDILNLKTIRSETEGWVVFHLNQRRNRGLNATSFCIKMYVLAREEGGNSTHILLNRTQLRDVFVLDESRPYELHRQPVIVHYILKPVTTPSGISPFTPSPGPFPFFKRSLLPEEMTPTGSKEQGFECSVEERLINMVDFYPNIILPTTVNIGRCAATSSTNHKEIESADVEGTDEEEENEPCRPTEYSDLHVLWYSYQDGYISITILPNAVIEKCGHI